MKINTAKTLMQNAAHLLELAATFEARYDRNYVMRPGSPDDAWNLHDAIRDAQIEIARLLDPSVLEAPTLAHGPWWERQDIIDTAAVTELVYQTGRLIACCSYHAVTGPTMDWSYTALNIQRTIAGLLMHTARMVAADDAMRQEAVG